MPFGTYDPDGQALEEYPQEGVSAIVVLASDSEYVRKVGKDLPTLYADRGYHVHFTSNNSSIAPSFKSGRYRQTAIEVSGVTVLDIRTFISK
jgi:hypothetical protein